MSTLSYLDLSVNSLSELPNSFTELKLITLKLQKNNFAQIPEQVFQIPSLQALNLSFNQITSISPQIKQLQSLRKLRLQNNAITAVPDELVSLPNLKKLDLSFNALKQFNLALFPQLISLKLERNELAKMYDSVDQVQNCQIAKLVLSSNLFFDLPYGLSKLETLVMRSNYIQTVDSNLLPLFTSLKTALLDQNNLTEVELCKFVCLNMSYFAFSMNNLFEVPDALKDYSEKKECKLFFKAELPHEIIPKLFLSSKNVAKNKHVLNKLGITHVLSIVDLDPAFPNEFQYKVYRLPDQSDTDLLSLIPEAHQFISQGLQSGGILVHCAAGVSRSATMVISYVMKHTEKRKFKDAMAFVKSKRGIIAPNIGFQKQLEQYEQQLEQL